MQLGSTGTRALLTGRQASHIQLKPGRSIHIPAHVPRPTTKPISSTAQAIFRSTRTFLANFVSHLATPGAIGRQAGIPAVGRSLYPPATHARAFHQGFSFPIRYSLGRTLHSPCLPRAHPVPRNVTQVGLGTARNFSTGRPVFQSLADNVPVVGRALWEADMDVKMMEERARIISKKPVKVKTAKRKEMLKPHLAPPVAVHKTPVDVEDTEADLDHYFSAVASEQVVSTYLLIPLAPTPTNRLPLRETPHLHSSTHPLLPFSLISSLHTDHATHTLRVSSLFARLDTARAFDDIGVSCSAYGDPSGLCTVLEVKFDGWSKHRVRSILGEAGAGWCVLEEVRREDEMNDKAVMEEILTNMDLDVENTRPSTPVPQHLQMDPSISFVLPTLDFSASFPDVWSPHLSRPSTPLSDLMFHNEFSAELRESGTDVLSDTESGLDSVSWSDSPSSASMSRSSSLSSTETWMELGFSSQFTGRVERHGSEADWNEPRESML